MSLETDPSPDEPPDENSVLAKTFDYSPAEAQLSHAWTPEIINVCCFKLLGL